MIKNIIFDVGNVLFGYDPNHVLNALLPENKFHADYLKHFIDADIWQDLDRGTVEESSLIDKLVNKIPDPNLEDNLNIIVNNFIFHMHLFDESRSLFLSLKKRYPIYILSNFQAVPFAKLREMHPFLYQADGTIVSAHHQLMKPEPEIYELILSRYQLNPNECVFIDDLKANIIAAEEAGINGIQFKSTDQVKESLKSLNVEW